MPETLRRRMATLIGALAIGLAALAFAGFADILQVQLRTILSVIGPGMLLVTPLGFALLVYLTIRLAPEARGSGIPQVMAATQEAEPAHSPLISLRAAAAKFVLTGLGLLVGASSGREGPTVQIAAALMTATHRVARIPLSAAVIIAGGAAGVSAAFNTPLAGIAFAIEELAAAYEQRLALLVMAAVMLSGLVSLGLAGDYLYFGSQQGTLALVQGLVIVPIVAVIGGAAGALFSRAMLAMSRSSLALVKRVRAHPVLLAAACGLVVAVMGLATGLTWGTGYEPARALVSGETLPWYFAPAKFIASLATAVSGIPGGIFAPSLAVGAGIGGLLAPLFPGGAPSAIVLVGMVAYFTGVVRAPLTAVIIIMEMTNSHAMLLALFGAAIIADGVARLICPERLYHGLSAAFRSGQSQPAEAHGKI